MSEEATLREDICRFAQSLYARGLTHGSTGNISARLSDGSVLITPTGSSFGFLDPARLSKLDASLAFISGPKPTKELPLHSALYRTRHERAGAVVHLHSTYSVALSMLPDTDPDDVLPPLTPYAIMQLGRVKLLPYFRPGDDAMGRAVEALEGTRSAILLANHGPVVAGRDLASAVYATEELEASARLTLLTRDMKPCPLSCDAVAELRAGHPD